MKTNMMLKPKIFLLLLLLLFLTFHSLRGNAQPFPTIKSVTVTPDVSFNPETNIFTYKYIVTNSPSSTGEIDRFLFDLLLPAGTRDPGNAGLVNSTSALFGARTGLSAYILNEGCALKGKVVQVAFVEAPPGWGGTYTCSSPGAFNGVTNLIQPGETLGAFVIQSRGLAGIRNFRFDPDDMDSIVRYFPATAGAPTQEERNQAWAEYSRVLKSVRFITPNVGPTALPQNCDPACMIDFLVSEKEQAFKLGWIDNQGIANSLDAKLKEVKIKLQAGQTKVAGNILKSFILDLIAQHIGQTGQGQGQGNPQGKHVNDNAFYLLKPNAEFILYKLGQL